MKRSFFQAAVVSILLYGYTTWTLTKRLEKKLNSNYTRMLRAILNKSWRQHPTQHQLYGHLPPITKTIQARGTRHVGHCWRNRDGLISDVLLWTPTYGRAKAGKLKICISQFSKWHIDSLSPPLSQFFGRALLHWQWKHLQNCSIPGSQAPDAPSAYAPARPPLRELGPWAGQFLLNMATAIHSAATVGSRSHWHPWHDKAPRIPAYYYSARWESDRSPFPWRRPFFVAAIICHVKVRIIDRDGSTSVQASEMCFTSFRQVNTTEILDRIDPQH